MTPGPDSTEAPYNAAMKNGSKRSALGERIVAARQAAGLSQQQVADRLGVTQQMVGYLEQQPVAIRPEQLATLSTVLHLSVEELLGQAKPRAASGPTGRVRQVFTQVSQLPKRRQQKIVEVVEALLKAS